MVAFFGFLRKSSLLVKSQAGFSSLHVRNRDVLVGPDSLVIILRRSKTIQFGDRVVPLVLSAIPGNPLCPRAAYLTYARFLPTPPAAEFPFLAPLDRPHEAPTYTWFEEKLRTILRRADVEGYYTGHSFRRGGASFAFQCGVPAYLIKLQGDWFSDAYLLYIYTPIHVRLSCSSAMASALASSPTRLA
jgi:hypothetical protein